MRFIGKVIGVNTSDNKYNLLVQDKDNNQINLKISTDASITLGHAYSFEYESVEGQERILNNVIIIKHNNPMIIESTILPPINDVKVLSIYLMSWITRFALLVSNTEYINFLNWALNFSFDSKRYIAMKKPINKSNN